MSSSTKSTTIDGLPPEMINELFKHLHPKDLLVCSLVNKRWHSIYSKFKIHRLAATRHPDDFSAKWCYTDHKSEAKEVCSLDLFDYLADKPVVSDLRYLILQGYIYTLDRKGLDQFSQLVHLEIHGPIFVYTRTKLSLNLPNLKVLVYRAASLVRRSLSVDCPQLELLVYWGERFEGEKESENLLEVKHPETIRKLDTDMSGSNLAPFKNVQCLVTRQLRVLDKSTLLTLPKMNELNFNLGSKHPFKTSGGFRGAKEVLKKFLDDVHLFRASGFKFRFVGFELTHANLDEINFSAPDYERLGWAWQFNVFYMANYQLIKPGELSDFNYVIDYVYLMRYLDGKLPSCFFKKFPGIEEVYGSKVGSAPGIEDVDHFLWFLKSPRSLRSLHLSHCPQLGQKFYDQLPTFAHSLEKLEMTASDESHLKFDFIAKLPRLSYLRILSRGLSLESMSSLLSSFGKIQWVDLYFKLNEECNWAIHRQDRNSIWEHSVTRPPDSVERFKAENSEELLSFFERFQAAEKERSDETGERDQKRMKTRHDG